MSKIVKETAPHKEERKRKRKRSLTREEKEYIDQHIENVSQRIEDIIETGKRILNPIISQKIERTSEKEIRRQERDLNQESIIPTCKHEDTIIDTDGVIVCRYCGIKIKKKNIIRDLFCTHKDTTEYDDFIICNKCKYKWKKGEK